MLKEESVSAGVRRITALTGPGLTQHLMGRSRVVDDLIETLKAPADQITARVTKLLDDNKQLKKELKSGGAKSAADAANASASEARQMASGAQSTANQALNAANQAQACCDATNEKIDRMFQQGMSK